MTAAPTLDELRPRLGELVRCLGSEREPEVVAAAREITSALKSAGFDLGTLAAIIANTADPIIIPPAMSGRHKADKPLCGRTRLAERLMRLDANPRVDLTTWDHDFIASVVATLRVGLPLSDRQAAVVERLFKMRRRRFHER